MSEAIEYMKAMQESNRQESAERRANNRERSLEILREHKVSHQVKNAGAHIVVKHAGVALDFWPGTGRWIERGGKKREGRGVFGVLKALAVEVKPEYRKGKL